MARAIRIITVIMGDDQWTDLASEILRILWWH